MFFLVTLSLYHEQRIKNSKTCDFGGTAGYAVHAALIHESHGIFSSKLGKFTIYTGLTQEKHNIFSENSINTLFSLQSTIIFNADKYIVTPRKKGQLWDCPFSEKVFCYLWGCSKNYIMYWGLHA
jgi:hypothetical protein